ncbi:hypothetical protein ACKWTF_000750 [Chironomus riparius]
MPPKKELKFDLPEEDARKSPTGHKTFRKSLFATQTEDEDSPPQSRTFRKSTYPDDNDNVSETSSRKYRKSKYPGQDDDDEFDRKSRISNLVGSRARYSTRLTQMFTNIKIRRDRQSSILRPVEIFMPTYRMESQKPFDPRIVEDFLESRIKDRLDEHEKFEFDNTKSMHSIARKLSEEILLEVKKYEFDRYKIFVSVTIGQKMYQGFDKSIAVLWDVNNDTMATFVYERNNVFGLFNVFGVYFD